MASSPPVLLFSPKEVPVLAFWEWLPQPVDRTKENGFKLKEGKSVLDVRKKSFTHKVVRHWNRVAQDALEALKARLDGALGSLI